MSTRKTKISTATLADVSNEVGGDYVTMEDGRSYYKISNHDQMPPFFISLVSADDHWLFISSNGALSAGRRDPEHALFPYYTDDKISDSQDITGGKTIVRWHGKDGDQLWEPFSDRYKGLSPTTRNLYKSFEGDRIVFEEISAELGLTFRQAWCFSEKFGVIRQASLTNNSAEPCSFSVLDGMQNIMPSSLPSTVQASLSTLVDAYRKNELDLASGLGLYRLSAIIVDRAEPSEALRCNTVWSLGLEGAVRLISSAQVDDFRGGEEVTEETSVRAARGAYFLAATRDLEGGASEHWCFAADVSCDAAKAHDALLALADRPALARALEEDIAAGREKLDRLVGTADGAQKTARTLQDNRHFANVMFNIMRGGVPSSNYEVTAADLWRHARHRNAVAAEAHREFFAKIPKVIPYAELLAAAEATGSSDVQRICLEYLPLGFSRRHGDPSRPWNKFAIVLKNEDGSEALYYAGNWRDIFQNWEALGRSFPDFLPGMVAKFVNASTIDGHNPYRITREGIDWEKIEADDPWSYIGYWGDHQIIYLLKLLEVLESFSPGGLVGMMGRGVFAYADVPYRIRSYEDLLADPLDTVLYDEEAEARLNLRVGEIGEEGKLVPSANGGIHQVNLTEKLLVSLLAKLSNLVPGSGIWLNTQRPEWNDANNALVGNGVSVVTLCYMRRYLVFLGNLLGKLPKGEVELSSEVAAWLEALHQVLQGSLPLLDAPLSETDRKTILDGLGAAAWQYRKNVYHAGFSGQMTALGRDELGRFLDCALRHVDYGIEANARGDGLYHSYNLMTKSADGSGVGVRYLNLMLEGQVAVLSSGLLEPDKVLQLLTALRRSPLFRADQHSYILYPDKELPDFLRQNNIPAAAMASSPLLRQLVEDGDDRLIRCDAQGGGHFHGSIRNAADLGGILQILRSEEAYAALVAEDRPRVLAIFEEMFDHASFTGRSGTFFGYEGLGSIYWHMVSKLLLAVQENHQAAEAKGASAEQLGQLKAFYADIRAGLGGSKTPGQYGAFPSDPYSHTPAHSGARQPGMTGQVKEDILSRFGELGLEVENGQICLDPQGLASEEFLREPSTFRYVDVSGQWQELRLLAGSLGLTFCQVPFLYCQGEGVRGLRVSFSDGSEEEVEGYRLDRPTSAAVMARDATVVSVRALV